MPTSLLKECLPHFIETLTGLFNESLKHGSVPNCFKEALVKPLIKKPNLNPNELKNYRPVSNLPFLSKILEKIVLHQLLEHLSQNSLLENFQSAYRSFHCTETALLKIMNDLLVSADNKNTSILTAFDTVNHNILLKRLNVTYGIIGNALL